MSHSPRGAANRLKTQQPEDIRSPLEAKNPDRFREDLIAMVYHDIRSPLSNIMSSLEVLSTLSSCVQDATAQSMVEIAQRSADRIQRLIDSLLDIHRLEAGQRIGNHQPVSLQTLVREAIDVVYPMAKIKGLKLDTRFSTRLPPAYADDDMIRRVLINLLENAVKFTPEGGKIQTTVQPLGEMLVTSIKDTGPGIQPVDQERIFEKFTRLNMPNDVRGLGLGLAYCRLAVRDHEGQIWVESKPGKGSIFKFTLPIAEQP
jgi:two-component system, NtrC family, sensor histidine kinase KinB